MADRGRDREGERERGAKRGGEKKREQFNENRSKQERERKKVAQISQTDRKMVAPLLNSSEQHEMKGDKSTTLEWYACAMLIIPNEPHTLPLLSETLEICFLPSTVDAVAFICSICCFWYLIGFKPLLFLQWFHGFSKYVVSYTLYTFVAPVVHMCTFAVNVRVSSRYT